MLLAILFLLNGIWVEMKVGSMNSTISMSQYNECAKDANDSYDKYEWQDTTLKVFGRIPNWDKACGLFYPEVIIGKRLQRPGYRIVVGAGVGVNPIFSSTNSIVSCGYIKQDTIYNYWRRKMSFSLYSIPLVLSPHLNIEGKRFKLLTRLGIGWYPTLFYHDRESYAFEQPPTPENFTWKNATYNAKLSSLNGVGLDGEVGLGVSVVDFLSISVGFMARMAKITGFEGSYQLVKDGAEITGDCVISYWYWKSEGEHKWGVEDKKDFDESQQETEFATAHEKGVVDLTGTGLFFRLSLTF